MKIIADTHTHTIISGDAFSTLYENIQFAKKRGIKYLCMTEHVCSVLPGAPQPSYFKSQHALPREFEGIRLIRGVEANIIAYDGTLDMPEDILDWLDWVIASLHTGAIPPATVKEHTSAWLAIAENPHVDVIGHCADPRYAFSIDETVRAFARNGKIVEVNNQSPVVRPGSREIALEVLTACKKYEVPVVLSSDGHFVSYIGGFAQAIALIEEADFPEELVLNADERRFEAVLAGKIRN